MKTLKPLLVSALAFVTVIATRAEISAQAWLETYYLNPQPAALPAVIQTLSREGFFEKTGHTALAIGFLAALFSNNPQRVEPWLAELDRLPPRHHRLLAAALWQAGHALAPDLLRRLSEGSAVRAEVLRLANTPAQLIIDIPVRSLSSMNLQWGAFLATGNERHIIGILEALGNGERRLDATARLSLAQNAAAHPRVLEICRAQLNRQPEEVQSILRAALQDAARANPRS